MMMGKKLRLRRFRPLGRSVIVAMDHGATAGIVPGLEHPADITKFAEQAGADGILVTPGVLEQVVHSVGSLAILLRIDGCVSTQGSSGPMRVFCSVEHATCLGVDGVIVNAVVGSPYEDEELLKLGTVASAGRHFGVPVIAEMLSWKMLDNHLDFAGSADTDLPPDVDEQVALACRIGVEMGADAIKTRYSGNIERFREVVHATGCPVLVAGGPNRNLGLPETLQLVDESLEAGAAGVVFGRRIWQHADPAEALRSICAMVHDDATVAEALDSSVVPQPQTSGHTA